MLPLPQHALPVRAPANSPANTPLPSRASLAQAASITWNVQLCVMLFSLAQFLKSRAAKLISQHFYK